MRRTAKMTMPISIETLLRLAAASRASGDHQEHDDGDDNDHWPQSYRLRNDVQGVLRNTETNRLAGAVDRATAMEVPHALLLLAAVDDVGDDCALEVTLDDGSRARAFTQLNALG